MTKAQNWLWAGVGAADVGALVAILFDSGRLALALVLVGVVILVRVTDSCKRDGVRFIK